MYQANELPHVSWLDKITFRQIEQVNRKQSTDPSNHFLFIDFVQFNVPIVFADVQYPDPPVVPIYHQYGGYLEDGDEKHFFNNQATVSRSNAYKNLYNTKNNTSFNNSTNNMANELYNDYYPTLETGPVVQVIDPEQFRENPIDRKYRRLIRGAERGLFDKDLKPNAKTRDDLNKLINSSPVHELSDDDKNLLWKFRYYLTRHKQALTKFLKSISWEDPVEAKQSVEMLPRWAEIDIDDALELLGPNFQNALVRAYAVDRLRKASDHELELYLLQLVQALRFEKSSSSSSGKKSSLAKFLIGRAARNAILGNYFFWYVNVEAQENGAPHIFKAVLNQFQNSLKAQEQQPHEGEFTTPKLHVMEQQINFINHLLKLASEIKALKESRPKKIERLQAYLSDSRNGLLNFPPIPLPLNPTVIINGVVPDDCTVFKSSLSPLKLTFKTVQETSETHSTRESTETTVTRSHRSNTSSSIVSDASLGASSEPLNTYSIIFKAGDDLRQDQLVIQIITLMDQLLRNENLDLKLTPYRILATGPRDGALQFVPNETLANVLSEYNGGLLAYLRAHNPDSTNPLKVTAEAMDTYVRSCAGYCVITYLLGVGDRHLDNLLICPDGHFFHADFGYILGHDPKPFPPMMKLPIQIIDGMGGASSENYDKFRSLCFTAYTTLRKSANLILNLFALMSHSTIPDIMVERDTNAAVLKVKEKFCLEMTEEEAIMHFQNLINDSVSAVLPMVIDRLHNLAQYWRA